MEKRRLNATKILNQDGSMSIIALPLTIVILGISTLLLTQSLKEYHLTKERSETYLCAKYTVKRTKVLARNLEIINYLLGIAAVSIVMPKIYLALRKALKYAGLLYIAAHTYLITSFKSCKLKTNFHFLYKMPYLGLGIPKRNTLGQIKMRTKWKNYIFSVPKKELDPLYNSFMIEFTFKKDTIFLRASSKETNTRVLHQLKHYYGLASSVL